MEGCFLANQYLGDYHVPDKGVQVFTLRFPFGNAVARTVLVNQLAAHLFDETILNPFTIDD